MRVGPDYTMPLALPSALTSETWVANSLSLTSGVADPLYWRVFEAPVLEDLVRRAYRGNRQTKTAVVRALQARHQRMATAGN